MKKNWFDYIILTEDNFLYTGITTDLERRMLEHQNQGKKGAKYLKSHKAKEFVYTELAPNRSIATKREAQIKKMSRTQKDLLIQVNRSKLRKSKII